VIVNKKEGRRYDEITEGGNIIFDANNMIRYVAERSGFIYVVEERLK
jgi:hypothetical protein